MTTENQQLALLKWAYPEPMFRWRIEGRKIVSEAHDDDGRVVPCQTPNLYSLDELHLLELKVIKSIPDNGYGKTGLEIYSDILKRVIEDREAIGSAITARYMTAIAEPEHRLEAMLRALDLWENED